LGASTRQTKASASKKAVREPRQARARETRRRLLDCALEMIAASGVGGTTLRGVADRAGVSSGVATYYFQNRQNLLVEAFRRHMERVREQAVGVAAQPTSASGSAIDQSTAGALQFLDSMVHDHRADLIAAFEILLEFAREPGLRAQVEADTSMTDELAAQLTAGLGTGRAKDDAAVLVALVQGLAIDWLSNPDDPSLRRRTRRTLRHAIRLMATT
jgi:AcrR family transcriptional regulator